MKEQPAAGDECQQNNDNERPNYNAVGHLSITSSAEDVESSDLQFRSIHMTNRSLGLPLSAYMHAAFSFLLIALLYRDEPIKRCQKFVLQMLDVIIVKTVAVYNAF